MKIAGKTWQEDGLWLMLDLMTQAESKAEIPEMIKDVIECLVDDESFVVNATVINSCVLVEANDTKKLIALLLKRQRRKNNLTLEQVAAALNAKSVNEYAQYEQGKHLPSIDKFHEFLHAINPQLTPFLAC